MKSFLTVAMAAFVLGHLGLQTAHGAESKVSDIRLKALGFEGFFLGVLSHSLPFGDNDKKTTLEFFEKSSALRARVIKDTLAGAPTKKEFSPIITFDNVKEREFAGHSHVLINLTDYGTNIEFRLALVANGPDMSNWLEAQFKPKGWGFRFAGGTPAERYAILDALIQNFETFQVKMVGIAFYSNQNSKKPTKMFYLGQEVDLFKDAREFRARDFKRQSEWQLQKTDYYER